MRTFMLTSTVIISCLTGCAGTKELPKPDTTTEDVLKSRTSFSEMKKQPLVHGRKVDVDPDYRDYTYYAGERLNGHFKFLPNPTLTMYVFQHLTPNGAPVPGYPTQLKMYEKHHYALPGEVSAR